MKYFIRVILVSIILTALFSAPDNYTEQNSKDKLKEYDLKKAERIQQEELKSIQKDELRQEEGLLQKEKLNQDNSLDLEALKLEMKEKEFLNNPDLNNNRDCVEAYYADGWCDVTNNTEECGWDEGDCCPGDCVDGTYECEYYGGDCEDCLNPDSADNATGGQCYESGPCGEDFLCWDGTCAPTAAECPETCEEQGGIVCWDGSCAIDVDCPDEPECDAGYVADCDGSGECCSEGWVGDGLCDGTLQGWGCDLTCYGCDGGDCMGIDGEDEGCAYCEDEGLVTCWDWSCVDDEADCPDIGCNNTDCGTYLGFGYYCDEIESNFGYDCSVCAELGECAYTCEYYDEWTCMDGSCADTAADCPPVTCDDAPYPQWLGDGYCDSGNNFEGCYDAGDCCESTCVDSTYTCGVVGFNCIDPEACENGEPAVGDGCCSSGEDCDSDDCADNFDCLYPDCGSAYPQYLGNGTCDSVSYGLNNEGCGFDGGDCCVSTNEDNNELCGGFSTTYCDCQDPEACENGIPSDGDGCCSDGEDCDSSDCSDTFDCQYPGCGAMYQSYVGNGYCESATYGANNEECGWDGGDCCVETAGDPPGSQGDCYYGNYGDGSYCDCMDPEYANFGAGDTCADPIEAVEGSNHSDGHDEYYSFTVTEGGFLELSTAGAGIDTKLYLYATCDDVDIDVYPYGNYIAYNDDFGSSLYGICPDCTYWGESYIYVGVPAGDYIIVSGDTYNQAHIEFDWTLSFEVGIEGCTNQSANNYDPEANIDDGTCEYDDGLYLVNCDGGSWQTEVWWELTNADNGDVALDGGAPFDGFVALDPGEYYLYATDSFGDGWNGNVWTLVDSESNEILSYTLAEGSEGMSESFVVEETGCPFLGDVNDDGALNVVDIVGIVNAILSGDIEETIFCGDFNQDGALNVVDIVGIVNEILGS